MKAITVHALWAWAIVRGVKAVENRPWFTHYRGPLWIHCGKSRKSDAQARAVLESLGVACPTAEELDALRGKVIGVCQMVACEALGDYQRPMLERDPLAVGPYCFGLAQPQALRRPVACTGQLSLWNLPAEVERICLGQVEQQGDDHEPVR